MSRGGGDSEGVTTSDQPQTADGAASNDTNAASSASLAQQAEEPTAEDEKVYVAQGGTVREPTYYETLQEAVDSAKSNGTVRLLANVDLSQTLVFPAGKKVNLNLAGFNLTSEGTTLLINGTVDISDTKKTGVIESTKNVAVAVGDNAKVTVYSGTLKGREGAIITGESTGATIAVPNANAKLIATDNAVIAGNGTKRDGNPNKIDIKNGTFEGSIESEGYIACGIYAPWNDIVTVSGGTFNINNGVGILARAGSVKVTGGTFNCTGGDKTGRVGDDKNLIPCASLVFDRAANYPALTSDSKILVSGGTFSTDPSANGATLASGYSVVKSEDGTFSPKKDNPPAEVNGIGYPTLGAAINAAAGTDSVVKLLQDVNDVNAYWTIKDKVILDLNGHNITASGQNGVFEVTASGDLTIKGDGVITAVENNKSAMVVWATSTNAKISLEGGTYKQQISSTSDPQFDMIYALRGSVYIKGGTYESATPAWTLNCKDEYYMSGEASIEVSGGTFKGFDPSNNKAEGDDTNFMAEGYYTMKAGSDSDTTYTAVKGNAQVGRKCYASVQAAVDAAEAGDTVKLLANATEDVTVVEGKNLTLDLNGFTLTNVKGHTITNNGTLTINDSSEAKTGTVDNLTHGMAPVENNQGATCTIAGGTFARSKEAGKTPENSGGNSYYYIENFGTMTIDGNVKVSSEGHFSSLVHNGWYDGSKNAAKTNAVMTINSGSFAGGINTIKNDDYGEITINGGDFKNATQHPLFNVNVATVNGGTFESSTSSAVYTKAYDDNADKGTTTIKGGTFKSAAGKSDFLVDNTTHASTVAVSGGTFSSEVPAKYCAGGFSCIKNSNGTYGVAQKGEEVKPSEGNKNSGSVATSGVTVDQGEQKKVAESASKAADDVKNVTVETGATETKIGDVTVDTTDKTNEVSAVVNAAKEENASVNVQLVVKAAQAAAVSDKISQAVSKDSTVVPFELSVDMVTEVKAADGTTTSATVPVKETAQPITVTIKVDPQSIADKNVMVARDHGGVVELIEPSKVNHQTGEITFKTAKFSDYAVVASEMNKSYKLEDYTDAEGNRMPINNADFNVSADYAFAGWYKDADLTQPCTSTDASGIVYPKFVKISDLIIFKGGSLRTDLTGKDDYSKTSLRFGYEMHAPEGSKIDFENWGWYYKSPSSAKEVFVPAANYWRVDNNGVIANFVLSPIYKTGYQLDYSTVFDVTAQLAYITADGTGVKVKDQSRSRSVNQVAKAIQNDSFASADDLAYANGILESN